MSLIGRKAEKVFRNEKWSQIIDNQHNKQYQASENNKKAEILSCQPQRRKHLLKNRKGYE